MNTDTKMILEEMKKLRTDNKMIFKKLEEIDTRFDGVDVRFDGMDARLDRVEHDVKVIQLTIENEIRRDIKIIAEGHLDLSRGIAALQAREDRNDKLAIDVLWLKNQMEQVNKRIDSIS